MPRESVVKQWLVGRVGEVGPGGAFVPELVVGQAPPQAAEEFVGEVAQCGV